MGDLFKALSSGLGRFVYAWLMPSVVVSGIFYFLYLPVWSKTVADQTLAALNPFLQGAAFLLLSLTLSVVFAYCSRPLYQFLEGYTMPRWMRAAFRKKMLRRYRRLQLLTTRGPLSDRQWAEEQLKAFPEDVNLLMPTRLGNALKAIETYGSARFGLDSQTLWYELFAVANPDLKKDVDETQGSSDFFISAVVHLALLGVVGGIAAAISFTPLRLTVALVAVSLIYPAYRQAVNKVGESRYPLQALVNISRPALAAAFSLRLPGTHQEEVRLWDDLTSMVSHGPDAVGTALLDRYRVGAESSTSADLPRRQIRRRRR